MKAPEIEAEQLQEYIYDQLNRPEFALSIFSDLYEGSLDLDDEMLAEFDQHLIDLVNELYGKMSPLGYRVQARVDKIITNRLDRTNQERIP